MLSHVALRGREGARGRVAAGGGVAGYALLERLLATLGYTRRRGCHRHPGRQVIFLGDFIDRGPKIRETLAIVRPMIESGAARAVMGNHELNVLAFHTPDPDTPGEYLRPRNEKNCRQHAETMRQLPADELRSTLQWFRTLPLWLDLDGLRAVHACWDACVDWSVAKGGFLCAYRWDGEQTLDAGKFVWV